MNMPILSTRRDFLKAGSVAAGSLLTGGFASNALLAANQDAPPVRKLRLLILGGTGFIGPWMVERAVERGHQVTLFNRGRREKLVGATDQTEKLYGNRDPNLHAQSKIVDGKEVEDEASPQGLVQLQGRKWDAVIDNSGYVPRIVRASAELLAPNVGQYLFISTVAAYADSSQPGQDETAALATMSDPKNENSRTYYGPLKALCEQAAEKAMPGRVTIIRPGYIVGPGDHTDRFTYWPLRTSRGGEVLVPGNPDDPVQFIDVRDLADFTIRCLEQQTLGVFNAIGPEHRLSVSDLVAACVAASTAQGKREEATFTYVPYNWLTSQGLSADAFPILWPSEGKMAGFHQRIVARAVSAGLRYHSVEETCEAILKWWPEEVALREKIARDLNAQRKAEGLRLVAPSPGDRLRAGISRETETRLLAQRHATK